MQLKQTGTQWNRDARKDINDNWDTIANNFNGAVQKTIDEAKGQVIDELADTAKLIWVPKVDNYADIDTTYPNPEEGWTVNVSSEGNVYRYDGTDWVQIQSIDPGPYNELTSQLAETEDKNKVTGTEGKNASMIKKGSVSFVTDDARIEDYTDYLPLFSSKNVPCCTGVITDNVGTSGYCTKEQLLELQNDYGWEMLSHTKTHPRLADISIEQVETELKESKEWLLNNGFKVESIAYPYGSYNTEVLKLAKKYYRSGRTTSIGWDEGGNKTGYNTTPLSSHELLSCWIDPDYYLDQEINGYQTNTLAYYQYLIDEAVANGQWLIISLHSFNTESGGLMTLLSDVIDYAKANSEVITVSEALDIYGNALEIGLERKRISRQPTTQSFATVSFDGEVSSNHTINRNKLSVDAPPAHYKLGVNIAEYSNSDVTGSSLSTAGALITNKMNMSFQGYNHQLFMPFESNRTLIRHGLDDSNWGDWEHVSKSIIENVSLDNTPSDYERGITVAHYSNGTSGLPLTSGGTVITNRPDTSSYGYMYQEYTQFQTNQKYIRHAQDASTWGEWTPLSNTYVGQGDLSSTPTSYKLGITIQNIETADAMDAPTQVGGTLTTFKASGNYGFIYQEYRNYASDRTFTRRASDSSTWGSWVEYMMQ